MNITLYPILMNAPDDVSGLEALLANGTIDAKTIVGVIGKTEGNGGANDFTRALATRAVADVIAQATGQSRASVLENVLLIWSGGCEGLISPHATIFCRTESAAPLVGEKRLALGLGKTRTIAPEEIGTLAQVDLVANAVAEAMQDAGITVPKDVHYVQVKGPLLTPARIQDADARGAALVSRDGNLSKPLARGILALGVAKALGEVAAADITQDRILTDTTLYSQVASTSVGGEVEFCEIILMGNAISASSDYLIGHDVLETLADGAAITAAHQSAGGGEIAAIFAKAEPITRYKGQRTTMMSDADVHAERHARAALSGVIAAYTGKTGVFISGGTEHQCAAGAAPFAMICKA